MDCRVVLAQTNPALGDVGKNLEDHVVRVRAAASAGAALIVFPELSLTGYFLKDQTFEVALALEAPAVARLVDLSRSISILVGLVERATDGRLYNSVVFLEGGAILGVHRKVHLVGYGMFEEIRDLAPGESYEPIRSAHGRFGILTCEDAWHMGGPYLHFLAGVDAILVASAGPARGVAAPGPGFASSRVWRTLLRAVALYSQTWLLYCNRVGFEDGIAFGGDTMVYDPFGARVAHLDGLDPGELDVRITSAALRRARVQTPLLRDEKPWLLRAALERRLATGAGEP